MQDGRKLARALVIGAALLIVRDAAASAGPFEMPASLRPAVGFWVRVYAEWTSRHVAMHDTAHVDVVYRVLDLSEMDPRADDTAIERQARKAARLEAIEDARGEIVSALEWLDENRPASAAGLSGARLEAYLAWQGRLDDDGRFAAATGRVRGQRGLSEKYLAGFRAAGRFMGEVQAALKAGGLPPELVALSFTESLMNLHARSVSGAVGPWQFLSGTGREYLAINAVVDERKDPILSTVAAARYLRNSKERLGSWGAAITAYNYGTNGISRAVQQLGTSDIEVILREYKTSRFGFAARNYYAEFLASLHVLSHADHYFPGVRPTAPWSFDVIALPREALAPELWALGIDEDVLQELNPALTRGALDGRLELPAGLTLRVPRGAGSRVLEAFGGKSDRDVLARFNEVTVKKGQTLYAIARKAGVTLGELCAANGLDPHTPLEAGMQLRVPFPRVGFTALPEAMAAIRTGNVVAVTFTPPQPLPRVAVALAARRPGPEPVVLAYADDSPPRTPAPKPVVAKARESVLTSAVLAPRPVVTIADEPMVLFDAAARAAGKPVLRTLRHGQGAQVIAGPVRELPLDDELEGVDVTAGSLAVPDVDAGAGAHEPLEVSAPPALPNS